MQININLNLKTKQQLIMTPELQLAVKILQYSSLELEKFINEQTEENPLLELMEKQGERLYQNNVAREIKKEAINYEEFIAFQPHLCELIENQLFEVLNDQEIELGKFIVGNLNQAGELSCSETEIAKLFFDSKSNKKIEKVKNIYSKIKSLDFKIVLNSQESVSEYIKVDLIVKKSEGRFEIISNNSNEFNLQISPYYFKLLKKSSDSEVEEYLKEKYKSALWLIKSIKQRQNTILKILETIIDKQHDFFEYGFKHLYTMTMQEVATIIGMHESTVSRATTNKYIQTPHGTIPFKMFFNSGIDHLSSISIKAIIFELIKGENKKSPLSDAEIAEIFKNEYKLKISRRTVAKYRNSLAIASSRARKNNF